MTTMRVSAVETTDVEEKEIKETPSEKTVKQLLAQGKQRGYVTYEELNEILPSDKLGADQLEDITSLISDMGINLIEDEEAEAEPAHKPGKEEDEEEDSPELVEVGRTDDPVRLYLR